MEKNFGADGEIDRDSSLQRMDDPDIRLCDRRLSNQSPVEIMLVQAPAEQRVLNIQGQPDTEAQGDEIDDWQKHLRKQNHNLFQKLQLISLKS